jgi:hypothetical protein
MGYRLQLGFVLRLGCRSRIYSNGYRITEFDPNPNSDCNHYRNAD